MNCIEEIGKAYFLSWIGDREYVDKVKMECLKQFEETGLKEELVRISEMAKRDWELPALLRDHGVDSDRLVRATIHEFLERLSYTTESREIESLENVRFSVSDLEFVKIVRGYCENCVGYKFEIDGNGFGIRYEKLIYAETRGNVREMIKRLIEINK
ncbi:MAG: hypothetical protein OWQ52_11270 [Metallosphaera prunae]|uniref:hypothetical protein n=1 Tax=Metallosphaera prunae TaxID=47304 RepID=UPI00227390AF|nr:hypothetical protein [Metallosphaera prunae]MCY0862984.1 hypothetical protein [Metallosphaera prunae]